MWSKGLPRVLSPGSPWLQNASVCDSLKHIFTTTKCSRFQRSSAYLSKPPHLRTMTSVPKTPDDAKCPVAKNRQVSTETVEESDDLKYRLAKPFDTIPGPRGMYSIPYIGTRLMFKPFSDQPIENVGHVFNQLHDTYGPIVRLRFRRQWVVLLEDLNDIETVFRNVDPVPYRGPVQPDQIYIQRDNPSLRKLTNLNGEEWRRLRSPLNVRMNRPTSTVHYLSSQEAVATDLCDWLARLQHEDPRNMQQLFFRYASESIGVVCFNKRLGFLPSDGSELDEESKQLLKCYKTINSGVSECMFGKRILYLFFRDPFYRRYKKARDGMLKYADLCITEAMREVERRREKGTLDPDEPNLLLSLLSEKSLSYMDVLGIVDTLMTAGSESTACGLQLFFHNLATNPDKQEKLAAEILNELGPEGSITPEALNKMSYLKAAVKESMRIHIPLPGGCRQILYANAVLSGYQVPKGTSALVNSRRVANNPQYYHEPYRFLPERWLRGDSGQRERTISAFAYVPFGFGPRMCIGRRFAEQEIYLASVKVLQRFKIGLGDNSFDLQTTFTPFCAPAHPIPFIFTKRA